MELEESIKLRSDIDGEKRQLLLELIKRMSLDPRHALELAVMINPETKTHQNAYCFNHDLIRSLKRNDMDHVRFLLRARGAAFVELHDNEYLTEEEKLKVFDVFQHECNSLQEAATVCRAFDDLTPEKIQAEYEVCSKGVCVRESSLGLTEIPPPVKVFFSKVGNEIYCFDHQQIVDSVARFDPALNPNTGEPLPLEISNMLRRRLEIDVKLYQYFLDRVYEYR